MASKPKTPTYRESRNAIVDAVHQYSQIRLENVIVKILGRD